MKINHNWISQWFEHAVEPETIETLLTELGIEVEAVVPTLKFFDRVIVARVEEVKKHPDADKLSLCRLNGGSFGTFNVVCGAANVREGLLVPLALDGAKLPGFELKIRKVRGILSEGMICSKEELGFEEHSEGIWELDSQLTPGQDFYSSFQKDFIYELSVGPNRPDCLGIRGILRELSLKLPIKPLQPEKLQKPGNKMPGIVIETKDCLCYTGAKIENVTIAPSPKWLCDLIAKMGFRSINNVVDATNYIMMLYGHPVHAFDASLVEDQRIIVRNAKDKETIRTLDKNLRTLCEEDILICDTKKPVALAGIMGGENSQILDHTRNLILEVAWFDPIKVRRTSKRLKMHTDASHRFERGMDPLATKMVMDHLISLILELAGGDFTGINHVQSSVFEQTIHVVTDNLIRKTLGICPPVQWLEKNFALLGCKPVRKDEGFALLQPSWRPDLERPIDYVEEVARIYGMNEIPFSAPQVSLNYRPDHQNLVKIEQIRDFLCACNLHECITYSFGKSQNENSLPLLNPLAEDMAFLRTDIRERLLEAAILNLKRQNGYAALFEIGKVFYKDFSEQIHLCAVIANTQENNWKNHASASDFFDLKGILESLFEKLAIRVTFQDLEKTSLPFSHPAQEIRIFGKPIGIIGAIEPEILQKEKIHIPVSLFEISLEAILQQKSKTPRFVPISLIPKSEKQLALICDAALGAKNVLDFISKMKMKNLENFFVFDLYSGKGIPESTKSLGIKFSFRNPEKTIVDQEMQEEIERLLKALKEEFGIYLRP